MNKLSITPYMPVMQSFIQKTAAILFIVFGLSNSLWAGIDVYYNDISGDRIRKGASFIIKDDRFLTPSWRDVQRTLEVKNAIIFELNQYSKAVLKDKFVCTITLKIDRWTANNDSTSTTERLTVGYNPDADEASPHQQVIAFNGAHKVKVTIVDIQYSQVGWSDRGSVPSIFRVKGQIEVSRLLAFSCTTTVSTFTGTLNTTSDRLVVNWSVLDGAEEYDLEWTYYDQLSDLVARIASASFPAPNGFNPIFENNATRINTKLNTYEIPMVYPNGYIFYRVRGARYVSGLRQETRWSSQPLTGILNTFPHKYNITTAHENTLNWQSQTTFAEDGKNAQTVNYFDGSLRSRQEVSLSRADATVLLKEIIYDHQGRPAVQVMPTPPNGYPEKIEYYPFFARNTQALPKPYSKTDFDLDGADCNATTVGAMTTAYGPAWYYSSSNSKSTTSYHKFIPDAEQYPFSVTEFTPDQTGRIKRQGGVGAKLRLGANPGRETQYFYGKPSQNELTRLFSNNVGHHSHYQKNMVRDQNGQYSVSYLDAHGRTIATALAGNKPDSLLQLPLQAGQGSQTVQRDLLNNVLKDNTLVSSYTLLVTNPGQGTLTYTVSDSTYREACMSTSFCYDCYYDVKIVIEDNCGITPATVYTQTSIPANNVFDFLCSSPPNTGINYSFQHNFAQAGEYQITKILTPSKAAVDYYATQYLTNSTCIPKSLTQLQNEYKAEIDTKCIMDCASCKTKLTQMGANSDAYLNTYIQSIIAGGGTPTKQDTAHARQVYDEVKKECNTICEDSPNKCDAFLQVLLADVSPGGQYAKTDNSADCVVDESVSVIFNNQYKTPSTPYIDEFGKLDTVIVDGLPYLPKDLTTCDFVRLFKSSWAKSLVTFHPEYCLYQRCTLQAASNTRDSLMWAISSYKTADSLGLFNSINNDPFFNGTGGGVSYKTEMNTYLTSTAQFGNCQTYTLAQVLTSFILCDGMLPCTLSITSACKTDQDLYWQMFRNAYLGRKYALFSKYLKIGCPNYDCIAKPTCTAYPSNNPYAGKIKRWAEFDPYANGTNPEAITLAQQAQANSALQENCDQNCEMVVDYWFGRMKMACNPTSDSLTLRPILKAICMRSCDATHPFGATTLPPGVTITQTTATDIATAIKGSAPSACDTVCNNILAGFPGPYEAPRWSGGGRPIQLKPETCVCDNLTKFKNCFNTGTSGFTTLADYVNSFSDVKITAAELDSLAKYCPGGNSTACKAIGKVITLPPQLDCGICKSCTEITTLKAAFDAVCPSFPSGVNTYNKMLTAYLNSKTGMQLTWTEYSDFLTKCGSTTMNANCKTALTLCPRTPLPPAAVDTSCYAEQLAIALQNAQDAYQAQIETITKEFQARYLKACLAPLESFTTNMTLNEYHYTLYFYDQADNLVRTVPPAGVNLFGGTPTYTLVTNYKYECYNQIAEQTTPDGGLSKFWYDNLGRMVVSQDARQAILSPQLYSYTVYDALGRVIEVGEKTLGSGQSAMSSTISKDAAALTTWINFAPASLRKDVTRTYYDNLPSFSANITAFGANEWINLRKRVVSSTFEATNDNTDGTYDYATHYSYDISGNVKILVQDIVELGTYSNRFKRIDYDFDLISGKVNAVYYQKTKNDQFVHRYTYDLNNRVTKVETSTDATVWEIEAEYQFYHHGHLARTVLGQRKVQGLDYAYTLQGWTKGVNSSALEPLNDMGQDGYIASTTAVNTTVARDAFAYTISYHHGDYKKIGTAAQPFEMGSTLTTPNYTKDSPGLFNGNIKGISQQIKQIGTQPRGYAYRYDQLNRLMEMDVWERTGTAFNWNTATKLNAYRERATYDANGNIKTYIRRGQGGTLMEMDSLTYQYTTGTNKLSLVNDKPTISGNYTVDIDDQGGFASTVVPNPCGSGTTSGNNYYYDCIGNLVRDVSQNSVITWSSYGKVKTVTRGTDVLAFGYDAMQNRVMKSFTQSGSTTKTFYIRDGHGNIMATYQLTGTTTLKVTEFNLIGGERHGVFRPDYTVFPVPAPGYISTNYLGKKQYELSNHLGNVLAVVTDDRTGVDTNDPDLLANYFEPIVTSAKEYYPFGMDMPGRTYALGGAADYRYGFNGKEADKGQWGSLMHYDYGFRIYNPSIGRFLSVDALTNEYPWYTPYQFAGNMPILCLDLDGNEGIQGATWGAVGDLAGQLLTTGKVNWTQVGLSAVQGAISPAANVTRTAKLLRIVAAYSVEYAKAYADPKNTTWNDVFREGSQNILGGIVGAKVTRTIEKYGGTDALKKATTEARRAKNANKSGRPRMSQADKATQAAKTLSNVKAVHKVNNVVNANGVKHTTEEVIESKVNDAISPKDEYGNPDPVPSTPASVTRSVPTTPVDPLPTGGESTSPPDTITRYSPGLNRTIEMKYDSVEKKYKHSTNQTKPAQENNDK